MIVDKKTQEMVRALARGFFESLTAAQETHPDLDDDIIYKTVVSFLMSISLALADGDEDEYIKIIEETARGIVKTAHHNAKAICAMRNKEKGMEH